MSFEGVSFSVAGLVVLALVVLKLDDWGPAMLGKRMWSAAASVIVLMLGGISLLRPDDFRAGLTTFVSVSAGQVQEQLEGVLAHLSPSTANDEPAPASTP